MSIIYIMILFIKTGLVSLDVLEPIYYEPSSRWLRYKERVSEGWEKKEEFFLPKQTIPVYLKKLHMHLFAIKRCVCIKHPGLEIKEL